MSLTLNRKPKPAIGLPPGTPSGEMRRSRHEGTVTVDDGSLVVSADQLRRFGNGDALAGRRELRLLLENDTDIHNPDARPLERYPASIRMAGPADEPALLDLWLHDLRANAEHIAPIDEKKVLDNIQQGTRHRGLGWVACIDGPEGKPVAMVVMHLIEWHWSRGRYAQEVCSYVHPDHRRSHHADDLLAFAKWMVEEMGRNAGSRFYLLCGVVGAWRVRAKIALYRRKFPQVGCAFLWPPPLRKGN